MATAAGAAVGSIIPGVGTASGALAAQRTMKGLNAMARLGGIGGKPKPEDPDNPISNFLKKLSGNIHRRKPEKGFPKRTEPFP